MTDKRSVTSGRYVPKCGDTQPHEYHFLSTRPNFWEWFSGVTNKTVWCMGLSWDGQPFREEERDGFTD